MEEIETEPLDLHIEDILCQPIMEVQYNEQLFELLQIALIPGAIKESTKVNFINYWTNALNTSLLLEMLFTIPLGPHDPASRKEYQRNFYVNKILCMKPFVDIYVNTVFSVDTLDESQHVEFPKHQVDSFIFEISDLLPVSKSRTKNEGNIPMTPAQMVMLREFSKREPMDPYIAEAFFRFIAAICQKIGIQKLYESFDDAAILWIEGLCYQLHHPCVLTFLSESVNNIPHSNDDIFQYLLSILLIQLSPTFSCSMANGFKDMVTNDKQDTANTGKSARRTYESDHEKCLPFFTYDFILGLIDTKVDEMVSGYLYNDLLNNIDYVNYLLRSLLYEFHQSMVGRDIIESFTCKVVNALLQQTTCRCVSHAPAPDYTKKFMEIDKVAPIESQDQLNEKLGVFFSKSFIASDLRYDYCLNQKSHICIWRGIFQILPIFIDYTKNIIYNRKRCGIIDLQLIYLFYPIVIYCCYAIDFILLKHDLMGALVDALSRFPQCSILHSAVVRLFRACLEDGAMMFGSPLPIYRQPSDPLKMVLYKGSVGKKLMEETRKKPTEYYGNLYCLCKSLNMAICKMPEDQVIKEWKDFSIETLEETENIWNLKFGQFSDSFVDMSHTQRFFEMDEMPRVLPRHLVNSKFNAVEPSDTAASEDPKKLVGSVKDALKNCAEDFE